MNKADAEQLSLSQELQIVADLIRDPNPEIRRRAINENLAKIALQLIKTAEGSELLAKRLETDPDETKIEIIFRNHRINELLDITNAGIWEWNVESGEEIFDKHCAAMAGYTPDELEQFTDATWNDLTHPDDLRGSNDKLQSCIDGVTDYYQCELRTKHKNGHWIWIEDKGKVIERDENGKALRIIGISTDITDQKQMKEKLIQLSLYDSLTGLYSRNHLEEQLAILKYSRQFPISFINIDVDDMKYVNDNFGHSAGDRVLGVVGEILSQTSRVDDCAARAGGDEFEVVLPKTNAEQATVIVGRIREKLAEYNQQNPDDPISISIGTSTSDDITTWEKAQKDADDLMYTEKKKKKSGDTGSIETELTV